MDHDICVQEEKKISLSKTEEEEEVPNWQIQIRS